MCGIAGLVFASGNLDHARSTLRAATAALRHRGPDDSGEHVFPEQRAVFGHQRLSVVEVSRAGHQPMISSSGRYSITFNGEIYNHRSIRTKLQRTNWRGDSDTETILAAVEEWGLELTLSEIVGMFAFGLIDTIDNKLYLCRDRMGEKPLFYSLFGGSLFFASELKAILAFDIPHDVDTRCLPLYMAYGYIPSPRTIYHNIQKLPPASVLSFDIDTRQAEVKKYWSLSRAHCESGISRSEVVDKLDVLLRQAVAEQMMADVPVGTFLSGGIDSSLVTAIAVQSTSRPLRTFSIGFPESDYDESGEARAISDFLGTKHTSLVVTAADAEKYVPYLSDIYDEPFADNSQIPTLILSKLARSHVTVALSGDGGDELFWGYAKYKLAQTADRVPMKTALAWAISRFSEDKLIEWVGRLPASARRYVSVERLQVLTRLAAARTLPERMDALFLRSAATARFLRPELRSGHPLFEHDFPEDMTLTEAAPLFDILSYLPDDILTKVDRATMNFGLECRSPLLDHRIVEFSQTLSAAEKQRRGVGKQPLRTLLERYLPVQLRQRKKKGFSVPLNQWLRGPLKSWADDLLCSDALSRDSFLDRQEVCRLWAAHRSGAVDAGFQVWRILMLRQWEISHL